MDEGTDEIDADIEQVRFYLPSNTPKLQALLLTIFQIGGAFFA